MLWQESPRLIEFVNLFNAGAQVRFIRWVELYFEYRQTCATCRRDESSRDSNFDVRVTTESAALNRRRIHRRGESAGTAGLNRFSPCSNRAMLSRSCCNTVR